MKILFSVILAMSLLFSFAACGQKNKNASSKEDSSTSVSETSSNTEGYKVSDSRGDEVSFDKVPQKIISLLPANTEIVYALGMGEKLIAVSEYCKYPDDTKTKKKLASGMQINVEAIIGLDPDVVLFGRMSQADEHLAQLEQAGIKVIVTEANSIAETYTVINMLGEVFQAGDKAKQITDKMKSDFDDIKEQVKNKPANKVYIEISPVANGPWTGGKDTFQNELLNLVGAENVFGDISGWQEVAEEQVISRNPDYILTTDVYSNPDPIAEIMGRQGWANISAIKNKKVFVTDSDKLSTPGPRLVDAAKELAEILYTDFN